MKGLIILTEYPADGEGYLSAQTQSVYINRDFIETFARGERRIDSEIAEGTVVYTSSTESFVKETPEEIINILKGAMYE